MTAFIDDSHYRKLEALFLSAPINDFFKPEIRVSAERADITLQVDPKFFHAGHSVHGSVIFKLLDDACYFACQATEPEHFLVTATFNIQFMAPVTTGALTVTAEVTSGNRNVFFAKGEVFNHKERLVATGNGTFMKSRLLLGEEVGYR